MATLSIIVPVFNERDTVHELLRRLDRVHFSDTEKEIIIVDDGSTDETREILRKEWAGKHTVLLHTENQGKGAAVRTGLRAAHGDFFVIQDADLEYDPNDLVVLLETLKTGSHQVVYGSRTLRGTNRHASFLFHLGGLLVTHVTNFLYGAHLTDEATCYKMFTREMLDSITLTCDGFEFCPEFTGKVLNAGHTIAEVPISYNPRSVKEGKKIKIKDGIMALWTLLKIRIGS